VLGAALHCNQRLDGGPLLEVLVEQTIRAERVWTGFSVGDSSGRCA